MSELNYAKNVNLKLISEVPKNKSWKLFSWKLSKEEKHVRKQFGLLTKPINLYESLLMLSFYLFLVKYQSVKVDRYELNYRSTLETWESECPVYILIILLSATLKDIYKNIYMKFKPVINQH